MRCRAMSSLRRVWPIVLAGLLGACAPGGGPAAPAAPGAAASGATVAPGAGAGGGATAAQWATSGAGPAASGGAWPNAGSAAATEASTGAATAGAAAASGTTTAPQPVALRLGLNTPTANIAPVWVAKDAGFFAKYGIDAELTPIPGGERVVSALISGEIPLTVLAGTGLVAARLGGADVAFYGSLANRLRYWLYTRPEIGAKAAWLGRRGAGTSRGGVVRRAARMRLRPSSLAPGRGATSLPAAQ